MKNTILVACLLFATHLIFAQTALDFNASNKVVLLSPAYTLPSSYTLEARVKTPLPTNIYNTLFRGSNEDHPILTENNILGAFDNGGTGFESTGFNMASLSAGWHHVAAVCTGGNTTFYIDGANVGTVTFQSNDNIYTIGNWQGGGQNFGFVDDVRIWNIARSQTEIQTDMDFCLTGSETGLAAFYDFEDGSGSTTLTDKTGNGYNGTLTNMDNINDWMSGYICSTLGLESFITTWKTDNPGTSNTTSITIPTTGTGYSYDIDWENDGTFDDLGVTGDITHNYGTAGTYTVAIKGAFPRIYFNNSGDRQKIVSIDQWGTQQWTSMANSFWGCTNMLGNASDTPDLTLVENMSYMFHSAQVFNQDIGDWDVSNVTDMSSTFYFAQQFNQDISTWDITSVVNMSRMFYASQAFNQDISSWNVGGVNNMSQMFALANNFNQDISSWNVSSATNMSAMFSQTPVFNQDISNWDVSNVTNMNSMFYLASAFDQDIGAWDISNVTNMTNMFGDVALSLANYDNILNGWSTLDAGETHIPTGITFSGGNSVYCNGEFARNELASTYGWIITDGGQACNTADFFITTWKTDNPGTSNTTSITIPTTGTGYSYDIDWENDGSFDDFGVTTDITHDYGTAGTYTVAIKGDFPRIFFNNSGDRQKIVSIDQWGTNQWTSMNSAFWGCSNLGGNPTDTPDISLVTDLSQMFRWAYIFNQDLSLWDVSNVTNMSYMLESTSFNQDISAWDVSSVTNMENMFNGSYFNQNIGAWNVSNVTSMMGMFSDSDFNQDIGSWNVSNVTNMEEMFYGAIAFNQDISSWDVSNVTNMDDMLSDTDAFNQDISTWDVSNVTNMQHMFSYAIAFNQDISTWNTTNVTNMFQMFYRAEVFNQDISGWNVSNVTNMEGMFTRAYAFNQDLGSWDVSSVTDMTDMFRDVTLSLANYDNILIGWNTLDAGESQIPTGVIFNGGNSVYCNGEAARNDLASSYSWTITDGGLDCTTLGVGSFENEAEFLVYPNPNAGTLHIKTDFDGSFIIINQLGQTVQSFEVKSNIENSIVLHDLADGVYFIRGQLKGKEIINQIVVKK